MQPTAFLVHQLQTFCDSKSSAVPRIDGSLFVSGQVNKVIVVELSNPVPEIFHVLALLHVLGHYKEGKCHQSILNFFLKVRQPHIAVIDSLLFSIDEEISSIS